ncbi:MAG: DinB family protein [Dehalococcoidia bacterium]
MTTTSQDLLQATRAARAEVEAAIGECDAQWEVKPPSGDGEDAWCPREVAQHVIGADWFFTNMIAQACGAPALERPQIDGSTPQAAAESLARIGGSDDKVLQHVTEGDLTKTYESERFGVRTVEQMLQTMIGHAHDHAAQLRAANA